jgi:proteasome lid subunit RPN8/RPN11
MPALAATTVSAPYDSLDQAAVAALYSCEKMSWDSGWEFGGIVLTKDGKYYFTPAQTSKLEAHFDLHVAYSTEYKLVGIYHTHPGRFETSRWFSTQDIQTAGALRVEASYIGVQYENGAVRRFVPGKDRITINYQGEHISLGSVMEGPSDKQ